VEGEILESSINLPVRTPTHVRNQGGPVQGTFGSNKPAEHERTMVNKLKKILPHLMGIRVEKH
jgi:hypothetical protein